MGLTEEGGDIGEFGLIENKVHCSILDTLQRLSHRGWESELQKSRREMTSAWSRSCVVSFVRKARILRML